MKFISTSFFILFVMGAVSQEPRHYNFTHYTEESGLISYQVNTCAQDDQGYIWIGTNNGLQRYDGIRYKDFRYKEDDLSSIPYKGIWQILFDKNKNMWIMSIDGKVGIFDTRSFTFHPVAVKMKNESSLQATLVYKRLITDEYGNVFLLIPGKELATFNKEKNEFSSVHNFILTKPGWLITDFMQQPGTHKYWMCVQDTGFAVYNQLTNTLSYTGQHTVLEKILSRIDNNTKPYKIFFDRNNRLWFAGMGTSFQYIYCYDLKSDQLLVSKYEFDTELKSHYEILNFLQQKNGSIWVSGIKVFAKYIENEKRFEQVYNGYVDDRSIDYVWITHLTEDREHNLWVGTGNNGLFRFNPAEEFFTNIQHRNPATGKTSDAAPVTFMYDNDETILAGVWGEGLLRYDKSLKEIPLNIKGFPGNIAPPISEMYTSVDGNFIWMAAPQGIYKYDKHKKEVQYYNSPLLPSRVREIAEDKKGNLWLGTQEDGVFKWNPEKGKNKFEDGITKVTAVPSVKINKVIVDKKGFVWIGMFAEGAIMIDPETEKAVVHFHQKAAGAMKLPEQTVVSILEFNDSLVLIATPGNMLVYNRDLQKLSYLKNSEGISGFISSLEKDNNGYLWVSTTSGLYRVAVPTKVFVKFNRLDGIRNDYFIINASIKLPDGRMLLGATGTMIAFDPAKIKVNTSFSDIHITDFKVMNQSLRLDSSLQQNIIELAADENSVTIDLSTLSYNTSYLIKYKLEGLDKEWKITDRQQELIYSYLPPGKYTLLVNTIDSDGNIGKNPLQLVFRINPPYWRTWWFYSLLFLMIGGLFFWLDKERMKRKGTVQKMRSNIAGNLHEEVSTALSNINVLSEMARLKADKEPQKSKEFIEQIHNRSGGMIDAMDDMLWAISPENDGMQKTVERMQEYIDALNSQQNSNIEMLVDEKVKRLRSDMQFRHEAYLLFKESIDGLAKAGAADCRIYAGLDKNTLLFTIQCKNNNCDMQQLNNLLHSQVMQKRLDTIKATLQTDIHKSNSILTLKVPV